MGFQADDGVSKMDVWVSAAESGVRVVALWDAHVVTKKLSPGGVYTIGRAPECEVRVDHPSVSRRHARLHVGENVRVEDLGSANGTVVGRTRLAARSTVDWTPGELLVVGASTLFLQSTELPRDELVPGRARPTALPWPESGAMGRIARVLALVAPGDITVLLLGETGVGKELAAETVHRLSRRAAGPFVRVNCAALPENLLESELFGHERGAFTGADRAKPGLLEIADGGSAFLDEVGELPPPTQAKLLRVLETREVTRLGSVHPRKVDVRFIAATNQALGEQVARGAFRKDLLYRLSGMPVHIPPLRERRDEILPLARRFAAGAATRLGRASPPLTARAVAAIEAHTWPGNVRELRNVMERAVLLSDRGPIDVEHLALGAGPFEVGEPTSVPAPPPAPGGDLDLKRAMASFEKAQIERALAAAGGNQTRAAELLGISRRALVSKLGEYGLTIKKR